MAYPIQAFTAGMTAAPPSAAYLASFKASRASRKAMDAVFARGGSIEEAQAAINAAYDAVMKEVAA